MGCLYIYEIPIYGMSMYGMSIYGIPIYGIYTGYLYMRYLYMGYMGYLVNFLLEKFSTKQELRDWSLSS